MPILGTLLEKTRTPEERRIGICVMIDVLEHSPAGGDKYVREVLPILMEAMREEDADLRQCAVFGVGVVVTNFPQVTAPIDCSCDRQDNAHSDAEMLDSPFCLFAEGPIASHWNAG